MTSVHRLAAIDIGTVTTRLLVADVIDGALIPLVRKTKITHLGDGVAKSKRLKPDAMQRVADAIKEFLIVIRDLKEGKDGHAARPVEKIITLATSASRDAENADDFKSMLRGLGIELSVISGDREAELSFLGAAGAFLGDGILVVDIGGGSTEVVLGSAELGSDGIPVIRIQMAHSFDIGSRRVRDLFLRSDPPTPEEIEEAETWIDSKMQPYFRQFPQNPEKIIAVAGTATSLVSIDCAMEVYDSERVHGAELGVETVRRITESLAAMPLEKRREVCGLEPDRADVIVAGAIILQVVLRLAGLPGCTVSESDILQGILLDASRDL